MFSDPTPDLLYPVKCDDFLPPISLWTTLGGLLLVATVGTVFTLASVIKYNVTVRASATVRPSGEVRLVQAAKEGTIERIEVKENQQVKQGDAIATIDDSQLQTKRSQLRGNIQQNQLQLAQIAAELKALQTQITAESNSTQQVIASAQADLSRNKRDYQDKQITTLSEVQEAQASLELASEEMKRYQQLGNTGAIAQLQIKEKEQAFKVALAKLQRTKAGLNPSSANVAIAQQKIAQQQATGESTQANLDKEREELIRRQVEIQNQISNTKKDLKQVLVELEKTIIRTPEAGTILKLELRNPGQVVSPGNTIAQIAPSSALLVVKARVAAQDIGKVQVCKAVKVALCKEGKVELRISAYPYPDYGTLPGAVRAITADAITFQSSTVVPYYEVTIQAERLYLEKGSRSYSIQPGMEVTADIISKEETILTFLLRKARLVTDL